MKTVQSIERALDILLTFSKEEPELGLVDICKKVNLTKGTVYRLVYTLVSRGFLSQNDSNSKYTLGPKVFEIGSIALSQLEIRKVAYSSIEELRNTTGETVHLVVQYNDEVVYLEKVDSPRSISMRSWIGQRMPMYCTAVGKTILASLSEEEVYSICGSGKMKRITPNTITSYENLIIELQKVKEQGYAIDDEENEEGLRCIAAPVKNNKGKVIAAISVSAPLMRMDDNLVALTAQLVKKAAEEISYKMGYRV